MDLGRIKALKYSVETESITWGELAEIDAAFNMLVKTGAALRDEAENATALDQLEELEDHATTVERSIYRWLVRQFGEQAANDNSWSTRELAKEINMIPVILGAEDSRLGKLLGEEVDE